MKVNINCEGNFLIDWKKLVDIQQGAKDMNGPEMEKLLNSLSENGFCDPFCVWHNKETGEDICIAGNQRLKAVYRAQELGWEVPEQLPANKIIAKDLKEATKMLLSLASTFGRVNQSEIEVMVKNVDLSLDEVDKVTSFIEFDIDKKIVEHKKQSAETKESALENSSYVEFIKIPYPKDEFNEVFTNFELYKNELEFENYSEAFRQLLKEGLENLKKTN